MENEWIIDNKHLYHIHLFEMKSIDTVYRHRKAVWYDSDIIPYDNSVWCCIGCKKRAPDHLILQWKLLYG